MTFSIAARCARTGMFGVAISSSSPAVGARCAYARAGVGAVATQNVTDPRLGPIGLDLLAQGLSADDTITELCRRAADTAPYRQLTAVDASGRAAIYSGSRVLGLHGHRAIENAAAAGNLLSTDDLPTAMVSAFAARPEIHLADRLLAALDAAMELGGEAGPVHSAGLIVTDRQDWPLIDLRVDWSDDPIAGLHGLWAIWSPQMHQYVTRAVDPARASSYGVPGDL